MKRSKRTKSREGSPNRSIKKQQQPSSLRGLVTSKQQSIKTSSEVSDYTQRTNKSNTFANSQDFDVVDDEFERDDIRQVFISEEEEKVIHKILEVARKGKINQKNAFQIPLKVLDNEKFTVGKTKFWKFASQLLEASMSIYEKRIQNTWISTNMIHGKLARMTVGNRKDDQNEDNEVVQKTKTQDYLLLSLEQFRDPKILDNIRLGAETLETAERINIPRIKQQFSEDPLFQRKIKAFDNNSLKGLLLNVFDLTSCCEIELFCDENRLIDKDKGKMVKNQYYPPSQQQYFNKIMQQSTNLKTKSNAFSSVNEFVKNNNIISQNVGIPDSVGFLSVQNQNRENIMFQLQSFLQDQPAFLQSQISLYDGDFLHNQQSNEFKQLSLEDEKTQNSQLVMHSQQSMDAYSQNSPIMFYSEGPFSYHDNDKSFHSVMTPWQMEFKEGKLRKKSKKKDTKNKREIKKKEKFQAVPIQFDGYKVESKKLVLRQSKNSVSKSSKKKINYSSNLMPPQLAVYEKINYKKANFAHKKFDNQKQAVNLNQNLPEFLAPDPSMLEIDINQAHEIKQHNGNINEHHQQIAMFSSQQGHQNTGEKKYNIRETKKYIYEKVKDERQLRISQINLVGLSPASALITFLHIANEKNMIVRNTAEQDDVILSWQ